MSTGRGVRRLFASTVLEKNDRLRYSAIKITTWLRINLRSAGPHAKQATSWRSGLLRMEWGEGCPSLVLVA
jgi:hypothetical protein